jgi:hypothetical protein
MNAASDNIFSTPPPIPPRPVNMKLNTNRMSIDTTSQAHLHQRTRRTVPPPLHNNDLLLLPQQSTVKTQRPLSSISSNESFSDSFGKSEYEVVYLVNLFFLAQLSSTSVDLHPVIDNHSSPVNQTSKYDNNR